MMLVYEYKLDGTKEQFQKIEEAIRLAQFVRNKCVRLWIDEKDINKNDLQVYCAHLAKEFDFADKLNSQARQSSAARAWSAITRFYDNCKVKKPGKKGYPRFQHDNRSVEYKVTGWKLDRDGKHITFTDGCAIGRLRMIGTREVVTFPEKQIKRVRLIRRADGYYCQFCIQAERKVEHNPTGKQIGIDVGLNAYYTDSNGDDKENPRYFRKSENKIKRLSRSLSRKKKGSNNRKEARQALAKVHLKIQRQREDFAKKEANALITSHDLIAYEDLQIRNMIRNRHLSKSISDASWGLFLRWCVYYAIVHDIPCIAVPPHFTSQDCSVCGKTVKKSLSVRTHVCTCGTVLDRDHNAARNILQRALETYPGALGNATLGD
jgi:putative transposase